MLLLQPLRHLRFRLLPRQLVSGWSPGTRGALITPSPRVAALTCGLVHARCPKRVKLALQSHKRGMAVYICAHAAQSPQQSSSSRSQSGDKPCRRAVHHDSRATTRACPWKSRGVLSNRQKCLLACTRPACRVQHRVREEVAVHVLELTVDALLLHSLPHRQ